MDIQNQTTEELANERKQCLSQAAVNLFCGMLTGLMALDFFGSSEDLPFPMWLRICVGLLSFMFFLVSCYAILKCQKIEEALKNVMPKN